LTLVFIEMGVQALSQVSAKREAGIGMGDLAVSHKVPESSQLRERYTSSFPVAVAYCKIIKDYR
jgi:hypothetical protein